VTKSGISKVYFTELPKEVQERFHYDPEKAAQYRATEVEAAAKTDNPAKPTATAAVSGNATVQFRNTPQKRQKQEEELRSAQTETRAMEAEARGDQFNAEVMRIRADYDRRIRAASDAGNSKLEDELRKQAEIKIIEALAREIGMAWDELDP